MCLVPIPFINAPEMSIRSQSLWLERFQSVLLPKASSMVGNLIRFGEHLQTAAGKEKLSENFSIVINAFKEVGVNVWKMDRLLKSWQSVLLATREVCLFYNLA